MERNTNLAEILFPVEERDVFLDAASASAKTPISNYKAIVNADTNEPFAIVTRNYRLVTNHEAIELAKQCFVAVFETRDANEMETFNVITPGTKSFCHVDLIHRTYRVNIWQREVWIPYIRVTNSYNRTKTLRFDLGFCRKLCTNGVIFEQHTIAYKYYHTKGKIAPVGVFQVQPAALERNKNEFIEYMSTLHKYPITESVVLPLACKALGITFGLSDADERKRQRERQRFEEFRDGVRDRTKQYFAELGENAYALLNIVSDIASAPLAFNAPSNMIDPLQKRVGYWIESFTKEIRKPDFNLENYLGEYARFADRSDDGSQV